MKRALAVGLSICVLMSLCGLASARDPVRTGLRPERPWSKEEFPELNDPGLNALYQEAAVDTYCIVWYDFEDLNWQGWSRLDLTAQVNTFFHVDDFAGLGGGSRGKLFPLDGTKSMWCGARPNLSDTYLCSFKKLPGYGNGWDQVLSTGPITVVGAITWSFKAWYDSEPDYDYTHVEYDAGGHYESNWVPIAEFTDRGDTVCSFFMPLTQARTKLRFHFTSDGAWSDEDGLWNTDGGFIVDDIHVRDQASYNNYQDFEAEAVGAKTAGIWSASAGEAFGTYSKLRSNLSIGDRDPCNYNFTTQVVFFCDECPYPSASYPGLYDTPFCSGSGGIEPPCQNEIVYSPVIDMTKYSTQRDENQDATIPSGDLPQLGGSILRFSVYADLPVPNLVFYQWFIRSIDAAGCPGAWETEDIIYWGGWGYGYDQIGEDVSRFVTSDRVQVAVGVIDMCDVWYLQVGNCALHTPAPWFDNVRLYRYKTWGPQWGYRDLDLFQDNFPPEETPPWGHVRADAANDLRPNNVHVIDPGDSIVVSCSSPRGGSIDTMPNGLPAVYMHVNAHWIGAGAPPLGAVIHGTQLQGTCGLWTNTDGGGWDIIQMDFAKTMNYGVVADKYMVDLNDSLFVPGYIIEYYFTARDNAGVETALPKWARSTGPYFEFTCLPTGKSDILFVDDFTGRGSFAGAVENYWMPSFASLLPRVTPDKYDVNGPTSGISNGPGSRANAALMRYQYDIVIWDSGDLYDCTISDGTTNSDKSNDCQLLIDWMSLAEHRVGLWVCGDDIAYDLTVNDLLSAPARTLMQTWCGVTLVNTSYFDVTGGRTGGGGVNPLVTGVPGGIFVEGGVPDAFYAYGGCPVINQFDCLGTTANGIHALAYPSYGGTTYYAAVQSEQTNMMDQSVRTMWFGFSYMYVRDAGPSSPIARFEIFRDVMNWMQQSTWTGVEKATAPKAYKLTQNFPNPFNPVTRVRYDMKEKGLVTVKIFNVAGQLVRTLVDGVKDAGSYTAVWDGKNNLGAETASGIYFYKMQAKGFTATKKMVLLR